MTREIKQGLYRHYKGKLYEVIGVGRHSETLDDKERLYEVVGIARHSETLEKLIVYRALYNSKEFGKNSLWVVMPKNMRSGNVTIDELVVYRALYNSKEFGKNVLWARPMNMFLEEVPIDGKNIPRFKYLGENK